MNEKLQPTQNVVELQGLLVNNTLEVKTDKNGRKFIGGTLEVNTGTETDECIIPIECMQYELKKDGTRNALYDRHLQMVNWPSAATVGNAEAVGISVNRGEITDSSFYSDKTGKVMENWRIRAVFVDQATKTAPRNNSFTIQGVVDSVKEVVNADGEPTGELKVELLSVAFGERIVRVPMFVTNKEGILTFSNLKLGSYCIKELKTLDGYILNDKAICFELKYKDQYTPVITYETLVENKLQTSKLEITKKDVSTDETLPNTTIEVYTENDELIYSGKTDNEGKITIDRLPIGKYYFIEKEAPEGYLINDEKMYFEVKGEEIVKSTMKDEKITGKLEFTKVDFSEDNPLPNTLIEIYNAENDELIFSGRTDENGSIIIEKIEYGKYYILEKEAPEGYELNPERMYFEIKENGEVVKSIMKDKKIVKVPNTDATDYKELLFSGISLIVLGAGVIIYGKKKNKK